MTMNLSVSDFKAVGDSAGNAALHTNQEHSAFVQGEKGAWIKSLLNIGGAREANANTIDALRQAVRHDPQYAKVTDQAEALLGRLSTSTPLTGKQVTQLLERLDTAVANHNKALFSNMSMRMMSTIDTFAAKAMGDENFLLAAADKNMLNSVVSSRILEYAGDFAKAPDERTLQAVVQRAVLDVLLLKTSLDEADLPQNIKDGLQKEIFQGQRLMTPEKLEERIQTQETIIFNTQLRQTLSDVSHSGAPLRMSLYLAMNMAGIDVSASDTVIEGLGEAIGAAIDKVGLQNSRKVSRDEARAIVAAQIKIVVDAYKPTQNAPDYEPVQGDIPLETSDDLPEARYMAGRKFANGMSDIIQREMRRHMGGLPKETYSQFEKDIIRPGATITVGGTTVQRSTDDVPVQSLLRPGEESLDAITLQERQERAVIDAAYTVFAKLVTGRDDAVFSALAQADKAKVLILASLADQGIEHGVMVYGAQSVTPQYGADDDDAVAFVPTQSGAGRSIDIYKNSDGDFVITAKHSFSSRMALLPSEPSAMLDEKRSGLSAAGTLTISGAELDRLSTLDWSLKGATVPMEYQTSFSEQSLSGEVRMFRAE